MPRRGDDRRPASGAPASGGICRRGRIGRRPGLPGTQELPRKRPPEPEGCPLPPAFACRAAARSFATSEVFALIRRNPRRRFGAAAPAGSGREAEP
ncbi:MAG: hypothetical protein D6718_04260 [Acidobacteria bacterium]|nr:MAG: hypothetical protein D6718_04260 [Acidobacteriota bacterium]